jgi:enoyl-CoA hydratase
MVLNNNDSNKRFLIFEKKESIGIIIINSIDNQIVSELINIKDDINFDNEIKVIIITGIGEESLFGGMSTRKSILNRDKNIGVKQLSFPFVIGNFSSPTIAVINGKAFNQSLEIALSCDLRICSENSYFAINQVINGEIPFNGGSQILPRLVGKSKSLELILTGEMINAKEALRIGLVNKVVPSNQLMDVAINMAKNVASKSPLALKYVKEAVHKGMDLKLEQGLRLEADLYLLLHTTRDRTEGIQAFWEKRMPKFEGR